MFTPFILVMLGVAVKYVPSLKSVPNSIIPYLNVVAAFLTQIFAPGSAHAAVHIAAPVAVAGLSVADALVQSVFHSIIARQLYEGFGRSLLEGLLGLKKS